MRHARISYSVGASVAAALVLAAASTSARADATDTLNAAGGAARTFTLTSDKPSQRVQFDQPRTLRICDETQRSETSQLPPPGANTEPATDRPVPVHPAPVGLRLSYQDQTMEVTPGQCANVTTAELTVSPVEPLEGDATLNGTVSAAPIEVPVRGDRLGKVTPESLRATVADIRHMLDQDDATVRATTAEFDQVRDSLQQTAAKLSQPSVASNFNEHTQFHATSAEAGSQR